MKDLEAGREVEAPFLIFSQGRGRTNRGAVYLNIELGDRSGRLPAKVWDGAEALSAVLAEGLVALIKGYVDSYRGSLQFVIRQAWPLEDEEIDWADYLKASSRPEAEMRADLWALVSSVPDADYRRFLSAALAHPEVADKFFRMPAAKSMHHAYLHGLLEHSLSVGRLAGQAASHYPRLNPSLLIAGAVLHDLGKIWEFQQPPKADYTTIGRLKGHLVMGCEFLGRLASETPGFPLKKLELLQHLILSHHGEPEFGAPVRPQILEAVVLHHLDNIDAKMEAIDSFLNNESDAEGWSAYHRLFGSFFLRTPEFEPTDEEEPEPEKPIEAQENGTGGPAGEDEAAEDNEDPLSEGRLF